MILLYNVVRVEDQSRLNDTRMIRRHLGFLIWVLASCLLFRNSLGDLIRYATGQDFGTHILFVIPISAYLIYLKRSRIFAECTGQPIHPLFILIAAVIGFTAYLFLHRQDALWPRILGLVAIWISGFGAFYGLLALRQALFPLAFLVLLVPAPAPFVDRIIGFLQAGSASVAFWLFSVLHVPVVRDGVIFHIPTLDLEITHECSGIRSSMVLLLTTLLLGEFVLRSVFSKSILVLALVPIVIAKNGLRIVTISLLTVYVDRHFIHGWLHQSGGMVFYLLGLAGLLGLCKVLKMLELSNSRNGYEAADQVRC